MILLASLQKSSTKSLADRRLLAARPVVRCAVCGCRYFGVFVEKFGLRGAGVIGLYWKNKEYVPKMQAAAYTPRMPSNAIRLGLLFPSMSPATNEQNATNVKTLNMRKITLLTGGLSKFTFIATVKQLTRMAHATNSLSPPRRNLFVFSFMSYSCSLLIVGEESLQSRSPPQTTWSAKAGHAA